MRLFRNWANSSLIRPNVLSFERSLEQEFPLPSRERVRVRGHMLILLLAIVCCISAPVAQAQTKMTIAYSSIGPMATGVWMAKESGAFDKYGIQADIILITSGPVSVQALIGGDLQAVSAASNAVINAILNGAPLIAVGGTANRPYHRLFVQPEINRLEDLRGKTLGVTRFGSITDNLTRILLRRNGLEGAVNVRQMGGTIEVAAAFQNRLIAGAVTSELRVTPPSQPKILVRLVEMGIPYSMNMIAVQREYYKRNPEPVEKMVRAYAEGIAFMHQNKERAIKIITKYSRLSDPKMIEDHYDDSVTYLDRIPRAEPEAVQTILEFMGKKGIPVETFQDNSVIDKLTREGFFDKLYKKS
jgi:NitT/TauT family transport system substrate-binding protein